MKSLIAFARLVDRVNQRVGSLVYWLVLAAVLLSAGNALVRYTFNMSSNAWLEIQWYLFSAVFLLAAGYTLLHNQHVRIDIIIGQFPKRTQVWIDVFGTVFFLLPMAILLTYLSWPFFYNSYTSGEMSSNAGGLILWPARVLMPIGFFLLVLQGFSELIKRIAYLRGVGPDPTEKHEMSTAEEDLVHEIKKARGEEA
jgi:TRAP-type mannitol/chloroaromatic compound transport system permease small subunit